jgi:hypothetical protein
MRFHQSMLGFKRGRYLKLALGLCATASVAYAWYEPPLPYPKAYGGTWLGYTLGIFAAALVLLLLTLGLRKRSYRSNLGSVQEWTSAHVYLRLEHPHLCLCAARGSRRKRYGRRLLLPSLPATSHQEPR